MGESREGQETAEARQEKVAPRYQPGGWVDRAKLPRGPNERALCRWCQREVPRGRYTFCGDACVREHQVRTGSKLDKYVFERDRGVCAVCRKDCRALELQYKRLPRGPERPAFKKAHAIPRHRKRFWDIDHVTPVHEGGGSCGLDGLRTLCLDCHRDVTARQAAKRAARKRPKSAEDPSV